MKTKTATTTTRFPNQTVASRDSVIAINLIKTNLSTLLLFVGVIISALSIVYVTNMTRSLNANVEQTLAERNNLHVQWSQLLLEKSTLTMQARVQRIAESKMGMVIPDNKSVVIVNE